MRSRQCPHAVLRCPALTPWAGGHHRPNRGAPSSSFSLGMGDVSMKTHCTEQ